MMTTRNVFIANLAISDLFLCTFTQYVTRVSINVAILDMTRNASAICRGERSSSGVVLSDATGHEVFCWTESQKGLVKGAFYFGYPWLQGRNSIHLFFHQEAWRKI